MATESQHTLTPEESTVNDLEKGEKAPDFEAIAPSKDSTTIPRNNDGKNELSLSSAEDLQAEKAERPVLERQASQAEKMTKTRITMIMLSLCIALFLAALDMTIITTALPTIASHFQASDSGYSWVGSAYLMACASAVPAWGKFSDVFGRKPILLVCNGIFMAGSLFCALSTSIGMLIGARVLQGIGGGGLVVLVNICISDLFSVRERGTYIGITGMVWAIASAVGPIVGGIFAQKVSWRWCFYINLPFDGVSVIMLILYLQIETPKTPLMAGLKSIDWIGIVTVVGGVVMFLIGLEAGGVTSPWDSAYTLCLIIFGIVTIVLFFFYEWKVARYPVIPIHLFQDRTRAACIATAFSQGFVFMGLSYFLPLYFQTVLLVRPLLSGIYTFPFAITLAFVSSAAGIIVKKTGAYQVLIWGGMTIMTLGVGLYISFPPHADWPKIIIFQIIAGIGVGPNFQSPLVALQSTIKPSDIATATSTFGFIRQIAASVTVVLGGVVFQNQMAKKNGQLVAALGPEVASRIGKASSGSAAAFVRTLPKAQQSIVGHAITLSLRQLWIFYTAFAAFGIFVSLFIGKKNLSKERHKVEQGLEAQERARQERLEEERLRREARASRRASRDVGEKGNKKWKRDSLRSDFEKSPVSPPPPQSPRSLNIGERIASPTSPGSTRVDTGVAAATSRPTDLEKPDKEVNI